MELSCCARHRFGDDRGPCRKHGLVLCVNLTKLGHRAADAGERGEDLRQAQPREALSSLRGPNTSAAPAFHTSAPSLLPELRDTHPEVVAQFEPI
jgi:hypothetical protein